MFKDTDLPGLPVFPMLPSRAGNGKRASIQQSRLARISLYAVMVAIATSFIAKFLVLLINLVTNIAFYGAFSTDFHTPADHQLGAWVIVLPALGGVLVGLMAFYGSKAIRGHGIPEAMEQILVHQSRIKPSVTFLKPVSAAIAIGTGGPFGAEGPIIATGGALGSTLGQLLRITSNERKVLLAASATAGMSAIFGTPVAAIFLAIELLLFEFSPGAILPVALAGITGAAGHQVLFEAGPVFPMPDVRTPSNPALALYSLTGILIGSAAIFLTKAVYLVEDWFEKLPVHWMWWPALGGLMVGLTGYFFPHTLGVGYDNITRLLSGNLSLAFIVTLGVFKFVSWAIALGSGTSGGTLAPLLTIGGAAGAAISMLIMALFPAAGISIPMGALIGMSAMFAGASRAYLTSVAFALEATMQPHALLPLLGACTAAYMVSYFLMEHTIMTAKIARRGVITPHSYEPDILQHITAGQVIRKGHAILKADMRIADAQKWLREHPVQASCVMIVNGHDGYEGTVKLTDIHTAGPENLTLKSLAGATNGTINTSDTLRHAVELMARLHVEILPVMDHHVLTGVLSYHNIIAVYGQTLRDRATATAHISLKRQRMKMILRWKNRRSLP